MAGSWNVAGSGDQQVEAVIEAVAAAGFTIQFPADDTEVGLPVGGLLTNVG